MSGSSRRIPPPTQQQHSSYAAVPQSPRSNSGYTQHTQPFSPSSSYRPQPHTPSVFTGGGSSNGHNRYVAPSETAQSVQAGTIGGDYGPYSYQPSSSSHHGGYRENRFTAPHSETSSLAHEKVAAPTTTTVPPYMWDTKDPDLDDPIHNPDPVRDAVLDRSFTLFSTRGWANAFVLFSLVGALVTLFIGYPIVAYYDRHTLQIPGFNIGGINGTGQVAKFPGYPSMVDVDTPEVALTKVVNGKKYNLVFSDEFETDGRTFWPGDDPFWEAPDLHYWATGDLEWYDPQAVTTKGGSLVITLSEQLNHDLNFQSGMLTSWNKYCFTTGYIEVSISLPGDAQTPGFWPAAWTMGNLGRAGYGATTEGMWPYTYDSCDLGTFPNQTDRSGNPANAVTGAPGGTPLSYLPGQRLSACTCPDSDHPGPSTNKGRGVPEIDIIEAQIDVVARSGEVSQSFQIAPYDYQYNYNNQTPATTIVNPEITTLNTYKGGVFQQALSAVSKIDSANYGGNKFGQYGFDWWSDPRHRDQGYITWYSEGEPSWTITSQSMQPNPLSQVGQRLVSEEPHYIIFNLGMSPSFQAQDFKNLKFPAQMLVDYVRVYQRDGVSNAGCNPKDYPTTDYINRHIRAYTNPNDTTWAQSGFSFPRNSLYDGC